MIIYHYRPETREYLQAAEASPDPRRVALGQFEPVDSGHYLQPANATFTPPPEAPAGQKAQWQGDGWELTPDYRGQTGYRIINGEAVDITDLGPWPDDLACEPKPGPEYAWRGDRWAVDPGLVAAMRSVALMGELAALDAKAIRPLILLAQEGLTAKVRLTEEARLKEIEKQKEALRAELTTLEPSLD